MSLPVYRVMIKDKDYEQLNSNIWSNRFVPGQLVIGGKRIPIRIRYRGGHTREYPKNPMKLEPPNIPTTLMLNMMTLP